MKIYCFMQNCSTHYIRVANITLNTKFSLCPSCIEIYYFFSGLIMDLEIFLWLWIFIWLWFFFEYQFFSPTSNFSWTWHTSFFSTSFFLSPISFLPRSVNFLWHFQTHIFLPSDLEFFSDLYCSEYFSTNTNLFFLFLDLRNFFPNWKFSPTWNFLPTQLFPHFRRRIFLRFGMGGSPLEKAIDEATSSNSNTSISHPPIF